MHRFNNLNFNQIGRMPRLLLALGVLALALMAGGAATARRADAATTGYYVEVTFESMRFSMIDDGFLNYNAEAFGYLNANTTQGPDGRMEKTRLIGTPSNPGVCTANWTGEGRCNKTVGTNTTYSFSQTPMCDSYVVSSLARNHVCSTQYGTTNSDILLAVVPQSLPPITKPGVLINYAINLQDYDPGDNDNLCNRSDVEFVSASELPTLNRVITQPCGDYGVHSEGTVTIRFRTLGTFTF